MATARAPASLATMGRGGAAPEDGAIKRAFVRTLATGAFLAAIVPTSAVILTRPQPPKAIVLEMTLEPTGPASDNPMMSSATR